MYEYSATVDKVIDADTLVLLVDLGLSVFRKATFRLSRINAPEMSTDAGKAAREYLIGLLAPDKTLKIKTIKDRKEKYGRYLVELEGSHGNISDAMLAAGHAVPYK